MRLTKYGHACVRLEQDGRVLVIDPGEFSGDEPLAGADAVLLTHEHDDHLDRDRLAAARQADPGLAVYAHPELAAELGAQAVTVGETFEAAGFQVTVVGGKHAETVDGLPDCTNLGFLVDGLYHPGDSLHVPEQPVDTLLVPAAGPWIKLAEVVDFARTVRPARAFPIHDAHLSEIGQENFDAWLDWKGETEYARIPLGESVDLG
ncbi:MBL fold metallo-hydrolase [Kitasatospora sp. NPDC002227]|uniref:MBL fold metallo-hydrolase n=1 Tax=Kitasatospora sp. NPDC002227 TaxID=3154773 RepID=UPI00333135A5